MVEGELLEVRPDKLRQARQVAERLEGLLEVQTYGDLQHVFVPHAEVWKRRLETALVQAGIAVAHLRQAKPRMEEAFISLTRRRAREEATSNEQ